MQNMGNILNSIANHLANQNYESFQQLAKKWRQLKQQLLSDTSYQLAAIINPQMIEGLE